MRPIRPSNFIPCVAGLRDPKNFLRWKAASLSVLWLLNPLSLFAAAPGEAGILWSVDWSADGKRFAVGGDWVGIFDADTLQRRVAPGLDRSERASKVRWHPQRELLAVSGSAAEVTSIYDVATDRKIPLPTKEGTRGIAWSPTGDELATAGSDGSLQIWSREGVLLRTLREEKAKSLTGVAWHPRDRRIVTVSEFITLYDGEKPVWKVRHRPEAKGFALLLCVEWHPSGEFFVVGDYGNAKAGDIPILQFWSADGKLLKTFDAGGGEAFRNVSWSPDGTKLASASDALRVWSRDGKLLHAGASPDPLWGVRWQPHGNRILTSSMGGRVTLWSEHAEVFRRIVDLPDAKPVRDK